MIEDDTTKEEDTQEEMSKIEPEKIQVRGWLGPKNGFGDTIDPGRANQDSAYAHPGVVLESNEHVCASGQPDKCLDECDERKCDGAPEGDCTIGCIHRIICGFASIQGLCLAESDELVKRRPESPRKGGDWEGDGGERDDGDDGDGDERGPGCTNARVEEVERTRPTAKVNTVHAQARFGPSARVELNYDNRILANSFLLFLILFRLCPANPDDNDNDDNDDDDDDGIPRLERTRKVATGIQL